jgi:undecaprenyl-diphosphatase
MMEPDPKSRGDRYSGLLKPMLVGLVSLLLVLAFAHLGSEVVEGETRSFDVGVLRAAQRLRADHLGLASVMRDLSGLGSVTVLSLFTLLTVGYLLIVKARRVAFFVATAVLTGSLANSGFKTLFGRPRPDPPYADYVLPTLSFPSGHATMSAIVFLTLGALLAKTRVNRAERLYVLSTAALLSLLVGVSRVALGVHWATDVLGGWAFGAAWALIWLLLDRRSSRPTAPPSGDRPSNNAV